VDGDDAIVAEARAEIARHLADGVPPASTTPIAPFHDPFAGAGTFAIEAQRLGLDAHASDLNPLAALLSTVSVAFAPVFAHRVPVGNLERDRTTAPTAALRLDGTPLRGLAHDVVHYGAVLFHLAQRRLGHLYPDATLFEDSDPSRGSLPTRGTPVPVIAWIWARTIPSPNPAFAHVNVPLVTTFVLDARPAEAAHLAIDIDGDRWTPRVVSGPPKDRRAADLGTRLDRTTFRCVLSDTPITLDMIDAAAREGRLGTRLLAIVAAHVGGRHAYLAPDQTHAEAAARAVRPRDLPDLPIHAACARDRLASPRTYGLDTVGDLFTDRQALNASTLFDLIGEVRDLVQADAITAGHPAGVRFHAGGSDAVAYADAVATLLALAISRYLATGNALAQWQPNGARVLGAFARPGLAMAWNFAEVNPFVSRAVGLRRTFTQVADGLTSLPPGHGRAFLADARTATVPPGAIVTADPPYYDDIPYADLSDFFYPWLRRALRHIHPDLFATLAAPQADELIVNNRPGDGVHRAPAEYEQGLADVFRAVVAHAHPDVPVTCITTIRERVGAPNWSGQTTGPTLDFGCLAILARAGLQITALWPVRTHPPTLGRFVVPASAQTPALVVARRRATGTPTITLRAFINGATPAITKAVARLCDEGVPPSVILVAALGPGLEVATGAAAVVAPDGSHLDLDTVIARARDITLNALDPADDATNDPAWDRLLSALVSDAPWAQRNLTVADRLRAYAAGASLDDLDRLFRRILADIGHTPGAAETLRATLDAVADVADGRDGAPPQAFGPVARAVRTITYRAYARAVRLGDAAGAHAIDALVTAWPSVAGASHEAPSGDLTP
jgi:putative DNA methylase